MGRLSREYEYYGLPRPGFTRRATKLGLDALRHECVWLRNRDSIDYMN